MKLWICQNETEVKFFDMYLGKFFGLGQGLTVLKNGAMEANSDRWQMELHHTEKFRGEKEAVSQN